MLATNPNFSKIVSPSKALFKELSTLALRESFAIELEDSEGGSARNPFFTLRFEKAPFDKEVDYSINVHMNPLDIILNTESLVQYCA